MRKKNTTKKASRNIKAISIDPGTVKITFTRKLPKNLNELAQIICIASSSTKTLIEQLPFIEDAESEVKTVERSGVRQQKIFSAHNVPFNNNKKKIINNYQRLLEKTYKQNISKWLWILQKIPQLRFETLSKSIFFYLNEQIQGVFDKYRGRHGLSTVEGKRITEQCG